MDLKAINSVMPDRIDFFCLFASAKFSMVIPPSMAPYDIPYILYIVTPPSMAPCDIPYVLYIKKA